MSKVDNELDIFADVSACASQHVYSAAAKTLDPVLLQEVCTLP